MRLQFVGVGPGAEALLTREALQRIREASLVLASDRLYDAMGHLNPQTVRCAMSDLEAVISANRHLETVVILASGDVGFYSLSNTLKLTLSDLEIEWFNGLSSLQYLAGRLKRDYSKVKIVSVHGRDRTVIPFVSYNPHVFVLTGGAHKAHDVVSDLVESGLGAADVTIGENLSSTEERLVSGRANQLTAHRFENLAVLWIHNPYFVEPARTLLDKDFERGAAPMTKAAVRDLSLARLDLQPGDVVYDVGAGTGSVAIAMARRVHESFVYAVERDPEAAALIQHNRTRLRAYNLRLIEGMAPECLEKLPAPDKVFVGGSGGALTAVIDSVLSKNPKARIVVNAITLETLQETLETFKRHGLKAEIQCLAVTEVEPVGRFHMMKAQNPIYVMTGEAYDESV